MATGDYPAMLLSLLISFSLTVFRTLEWLALLITSPRSARGFHSNLEDEKPSNKISSPLTNLKSSYDVVVVGSGYGGGVAASRMSRAQPKQSVCVLEAGSEHWPMQFDPQSVGYCRSFLKVLTEFRVTGLHFGSRGIWPLNIGKPDGLYHWIYGKGSSAFMGQGLGGTSLINANVFMKPDARVFESSEWPIELRQPSALDEYFERAEAMLQPEACPDDFLQPRKYKTLQQQAIAVGLRGSFGPVRQTVAFHKRFNASGVQLSANELNGQDSLGLDDGSKNTVLATYLTDAWKNGAEIYCGCSVRIIRKHPDGGYLVFFRDPVSALPLGNSHGKLLWVHAKKLAFLGAGSIGSTEIILRSQREGLSTSPSIGMGVSGNGGMLSFGYDLNVDTSHHRDLKEGKLGPTITGVIDCRGTRDMEEGFVIQDGAFTSMSPMFRIMKPLLSRRAPSRGSLATKIKRLFRLFNPFTNALRNSQVYLTLSHDNACGSIALENDLPVLDMRGVERESSLERIKSVLVKMTDAFDGSHLQWKNKVTAHPLGGLGFAADDTGRSGSVSHAGELFTGTGSEVHSGLCVVDGSVISRSLGANPFATITALAERSVDLIAQANGLSMAFADTGTFHTEKAQPLLHFSEKMTGNIRINDQNSPLTLYADVQFSEKTGKNEFRGRLSGTLDCPHVSSEQLMIEEGGLILFQQDPMESCQRIMRYTFITVTTKGDKYFMTGRKLINSSVTFSPFRLWRATTTLFIDVKNADGSRLGSGELNISFLDFLDQLRTLDTSGSSHNARWRLFVDFIRSFTYNLMSMFFSPFALLQYPGDAAATSLKISKAEQKAPPTTRLQLTASDGINSTLRMWDPVKDSADERSTAPDVLFIPGASVSHLIFASPYIRQNAIEHFTSKGYRTWCLTTRFGKQSSKDNSANAWTSYDARLDIEAALEEIKRYHADRSSKLQQPPYIIAHCVGSLALSSALLTGTVPKESISGITASQIFLHPVLQPLNDLKAALSLTKLYRLLAGDWFALDITRPQSSNSLIQSALDTLLRFYPVTSARELCNSNVCHRCLLPFGRLWNHENLNATTHENLHRIFGGVSIRCVEHLARSGRQQAVLDADSRSLLTDGNLQRLSGIPILLISGADNNVYSSESTLKTLRVLRARGGCVRRKVFADVGHLCGWIGERGAEPRGVYETVEGEVRRVMGSRSKVVGSQKAVN